MNKEYVLTEKMISYYENDPHQIQHFLKVHAFSKHIAEGENLSDKLLEIVLSAALVHDIGIKNAMIKFGNSNGKLQEQEGPLEAEKILKESGYDDVTVKRVSFLVSRHHTYNCILGIDYHILVEADFLVNFFEGKMEKPEIRNVYNKIFKTETGKHLCKVMYNI